MSLVAILMLTFIVACCLAPAVCAMRKRMWRALSLWASLTAALLLAAWLVEAEPLRAALVSCALWLELWLWRIAQYPMVPDTQLEANGDAGHRGTEA